jgi:two-component system sensor histidine kinase ChvG
MLYELAHAYEPPEDARGHVEVAFRGPKPTGAIVLGQEGPLGQVFRNLIDNARSFSPERGCVVVAVEVVRGRDGALVRATVEDEGPGIPEENLETIFERFYTQRPAGAAFGGNSGLGLSIARQIVEAHRGRIYAENIVRAGPVREGGGGGGARLVVELPLAFPQRS